MGLNRKTLLNILKAVISVGLILLALRQADSRQILDRVAQIPLWAIGASVGLVLAQMPLRAWRWWRIVRVMDVSMPLMAAIRFLMITVFFNQVLPSSVGGDVFRIWLLRRHSMSLSGAAANIILDRLIGMAGLLLVALAGLPVLLHTVDSPALRLSVPIVLLIFGGGLAVFLALGMPMAERLDHIRALRPLTLTARTAWNVLARRLECLGIAANAVLCQVLTIATIFVVARGMGVDVSFGLLAALIPPVLLLTLLPISIAGWGVREGGMTLALGFAGIPSSDAVALALMFGFVNLLAALPGGLVWALADIAPAEKLAEEARVGVADRAPASPV